MQWCVSCFKGLTDPVVVDGREIPLAMIKKQKNDDTMEEGWVLCSGCNKWQHQICALFNHRRHDQSPSRNYFCPRCLLHELKHALEGGYRIPQPRMKRAADLDQVRTAFCDRCVRERVLSQLRRRPYTRVCFVVRPR